MEDKSILKKLMELTMQCQTKHTREAFQLLKCMPDTPEKAQLIDDLRNSYNAIMSDCTAILEAERKYLKIQSQ